MKKNYKKNEVMKMNKIKTKLKQRQNEQNKKVQNLQQNVSYVSSQPQYISILKFTYSKIKLTMYY